MEGVVEKWTRTFAATEALVVSVAYKTPMFLVGRKTLVFISGMVNVKKRAFSLESPIVGRFWKLGIALELPCWSAPTEHEHKWFK